MNVYRGGSLYQYLPDVPRPDPLVHTKGEDNTYPRHHLTLEQDSIPARLLGKTDVLANSSHKQAVRQVGRGLRIIGKSPDGVIEGIEDPTLPLFLGVQWHPERLHDEEDHLKLFKLLVERAAEER